MADSTAQKGKKKTPKRTGNYKAGPGRPPLVGGTGVARARTLKFDAALETAFLAEYELRKQLYIDLEYTEAAAVRQLVREALTAARSARERGQQTLPLESTTTKS